MAAAYVGGAALEATFLEVFAVLHDTVKNVGSKAHMFKPILKHLESTLDRLLPMIKDIKLLSQQLDCPEEETWGWIEEMRKGEKLFRKCSKIRWWKYCFKVHYAIKLCKLDEDIAKFGQVDLQMRKTTLVQMLCPEDKIEVQNESNFPVKVHPLPLSPGAAMPSPSAPAPQPIAESESLWMNSQWHKGRLIGGGSFGSVYLATNRETGALFAMKEIDLFPDDPKSAVSIKQLQQEIEVLSQLKHPNIVQYYGSEIVDDRFFIYLEYVHPSSINKYVREHFGTITESVVRNFTRHILSGLAYLHSTKTIHRDIRGANLLVDSSGVRYFLAATSICHRSLSSPTEIIVFLQLMQAVLRRDSSSDVALAVDIWSLGCTIIEMFTGKAPWGEYKKDAAIFKRLPEERPSAAMLLEHPFVKNLGQLDGPSCD
ncbi:hypothetical protein SO802_025557 [Lithocarpus litseifolius]|uniref:mitogen-activated protein kinase kinase kinase n=1 Tax=Lithocarpus litseifolius TaxID=425828 RepID=A0AAW2BZN1_9ROSI